MYDGKDFNLMSSRAQSFSSVVGKNSKVPQTIFIAYFELR